jgi:hypothetical protein
MKDRFIWGSLGLVLVSLTTPAYAYLDGATGSMLIQAAIGGIASAMVVGRVYLAKIKEVTARVFKKNSGQSEL